jgi:hypothetical protein
LWSLVGAAIVGYVPGAVVYRLPILDRARRGALWAEERAFWHVLISVAWSLLVVFASAALGVYRYERLLAINLVVSLGLVAAARGRLSWHGKATKVTIAAIVPIAIVALGIWRFGPGSEYVFGGKDPGIYVNEGVAIARTGALFRHDATVSAVPAAARELFFPNESDPDFYGHRFMGVYINDPATGEIITQFPQLFPASVAVAYGLAGIVGAVKTVAVWAVLGLLAVYFFWRAADRTAGVVLRRAAARLESRRGLVRPLPRCGNADADAGLRRPARTRARTPGRGSISGLGRPVCCWGFSSFSDSTAS